MSRSLSIAVGPEALLAALTAVVFLYCARHMSYGAADVRALERLIWLVPLAAVPLAFAPMTWIGGKTWAWLIRANVAVVVCLMICSLRIVSGFGAPGSGAKGQDVGFILMVSLGVVLSSIANAICGAMILRHQQPGLAEWFRTHPVGGPVFTALATIPIFIAQAIATGVAAGLLAMVVAAFKR